MEPMVFRKAGVFLKALAYTGSVLSASGRISCPLDAEDAQCLRYAARILVHSPSSCDANSRCSRFDACEMTGYQQN